MMANPPQISKQLEDAWALRSSGSFQEALDLLAESKQFHADLYAARGGIEFALGRFQEAALSYSAVALSQPANPDAHYNVALCLQRSGRWDAAADAFRRVLCLDADWTEPRLGLGACLLEMNRAEDAIEIFDQASEGCRQGLALLGKAAALHKLGQYDQAGEIYRKLLASEPNCEEVLSNSITLSIDADNLGGVREYSRRLLDICPHSVVALQGLVTAALQDGNHQGAFFYCSRLLDVAPDCLEAWHNFRIAIEEFQFGSAESAFTVRLGEKV